MAKRCCVLSTEAEGVSVARGCLYAAAFSVAFWLAFAVAVWWALR